jgi:hypothetical protein
VETAREADESKKLLSATLLDKTLNVSLLKLEEIKKSFGGV